MQVTIGAGADTLLTPVVYVNRNAANITSTSTSYNTGNLFANIPALTYLNADIVIPFNCIVNLTAGDVIKIYVIATSGRAYTFSFLGHFSMHMI